MERDPDSLVVLQSNLERLPGPGDWTVIRADVLRTERWQAAGLPADVVLADPPYRKGYPQLLLGALAGSRPPLNPDGVLVIEHESEIEPVHPDWETADRRRYGDTMISFYRWAPSREGSSDANRDLSGNV